MVYLNLVQKNERKITPLLGDTDFIGLPVDNCIFGNVENHRELQKGMVDLISFIYPNIERHVSNRNWLAERAILAPVNTAVDEINELFILTNVFQQNI